MSGFSMNTVLLVGIFLIISWVVRLVVFKDVSRRSKDHQDDDK